MLITVIFFCQVCSYCFNTQCRDSYGRVLLHCNLKLLKSFFFFNLNLSLSFLLVRICLVYGSPFFHSWSPVSLYFNCVLSTELEFVKPTCIWFLYAKFTPLIFIIMTNILGSLYIYLCIYAVPRLCPAFYWLLFHFLPYNGFSSNLFPFPSLSWKWYIQILFFQGLPWASSLTNK